ncbi:hypothetical protein PMIN03_003544 [Paraphaeosphaeria minitans]
MPSSHAHEIDLAFAGNHELRKRVHAAIDQTPTQSTLFRDISAYMLSQASQPSSEPTTKKRKLEDANGAQSAAPAPAPAASSLTSAATKAWRQYPGTSFSLPQRKKYTLELVGNKDGGVRALGADGSVEFSIAWTNVDQVFCLPVPEKAKRQHNFIVLPILGDGLSPGTDLREASPPEPIVWTFEEATGKNIVEGEDPGPGPMAEAIDHCLMQAATGKAVIFPDADQFESAIPQSHRKGEKAYHVKGHRGSKEGYLFFTSAGILWGFKKPLAFFDFASVTAVSYTNVLRNTFNLVITTQTGDIEFGMIDQADFNGINEYVQKHGLQDASMAATRRAQKLNVNPPKEKENGADGTAAVEPDHGLTELQRAEMQLQDMEDDEEDEEDYDPGSEGESEGSGSDSDDEDGEGYEGGQGEEYDEDDEEGAEGEEVEA